MDLLGFITWDVTPWIFRTDTSMGIIEVRYYGLMFALAFYVGYKIMEGIYKREGFPVAELDTFTVYVIVGTIVGARLGHVFFYDWDQYKDNLSEIIMIQKGGLASHGAAIGIALAVFLFSLRTKRSIPAEATGSTIKKHLDYILLPILDRLAITVALGGAFVRLGNLFNSEIVGSPTDVPWGFKFVNEHGAYSDGLQGVVRHPAQLYESICYVAIFFFLRYLYKRFGKETPPGLLLGWFFAPVFTARFIIEFFKEVQVEAEIGLTLNFGQRLSIPFIIIGIALILYSRLNKPAAIKA